MPLYNAGKSALSAFTQSMILEGNNKLRWIDFRLGDISTGFNKSAPKQELKDQNRSMRNAWNQIEKQLDESPDAVFAASQIIRAVDRGSVGTIYGGGFFQARISPFLRIFLGNRVLDWILRLRYGMYKFF
jgi:hypothetical protein